MIHPPPARRESGRLFQIRPYRAISTRATASAALAALLASAATLFAQTTDFTFAEPIVIQLPNSHFPSDIAAGDLNGNGNLDLVVPGRNNDGIVHVLLGNGDGTFAAPQSFTVAGQTDHAVLADFNGNGKLDLALSMRSFTGRVAVLFGNGDGTFADEPDYLFVGRLPQSLVGSDLNGNGHVDLVVGNYHQGTVRVMFNDGSGSFTLAEPIFIDEFVAGLSFPHRMDLGDLTGSGALDLAVSNLGTGRISILFNDGAGNFTIDRSYRLPQSNDLSTSSSMAVITDVSGDGLPDLVSTMAVGLGQQDKFAVFRGVAGIFDPPETFDANPAGLIFSIATADFDGDGREDIVISSGFSTQLSFFQNVSESDTIAFLSPKVISSSVGFAYHLRPMDVNNNGAIDLVYPDIQGHRVQILLNLTLQKATGSPGQVHNDTVPDRTSASTASPERTAPSERGPDLRELLGITDSDTVQDILIKLQSIGDKP